MPSLMTPVTIAQSRVTYALTFTQRGDVYMRNPVGGRNDLLVFSNLPCRLTHVNSEGAGSVMERNQLNAVRRLVWIGSYVLPEVCEVRIEGVVWRPSPGTFANYQAVDGTSLYRACDVTRQQG